MIWLRRLLDYIEQHRYQSLGGLFLLTFVPVVGVFSILVAALVTLVKGALEGAIFTLAATVPLLIKFWWSESDFAIPLALWAGIGVAVASNLLTWVFAVMLRRHMNWSAMLQVAALVGVLVISVLHLAYPNVAVWWGEQLQSFYHQVASIASEEQTQKAVKTALTEVQAESISVTKYYASGMMVSAILFNAMMQLMVARWMQGILYSPRMLRRELHGIRLSSLAGFLFMASLVFWYLGNSVVLDIMPILFLLFAAAGLSVIHYFLGLFESPTTWFWLVLLYVALIIALPASIMVISIIALLDVWLDLRRRFKKVN